MAQRAALYLGAVRATYYGARFPGLSSHPGDGSTCKTNCRCHLEERGDGVWWVLDSAEHCTDFRRVQRAPLWSESMMNIERIPVTPDISEPPLSLRTMALAWAVREGLRILLRAVEESCEPPRSFETQAERRERRR